MRSPRTGQEAAVARALGFAPNDAVAFVDVCYHAILGRAPDGKGLASYADMIVKSPTAKR